MNSFLAMWLAVFALAQEVPKGTLELSAPPKPGEKITEASLWCGKDRRGCDCFEPLDCGAGGCSTYEGELAEITKVMKDKHQSFNCSYAETGSCGDWHYIYCDKAVMGYQLRLFDASGKLRSTKNLSDYDEFCGGRAPRRYVGELPTCGKLKRQKRLSGKGSTPTLEDWTKITAK